MTNNNKLSDGKDVFIVPEDIINVRADKVLVKMYPEYSRSVLQKILDSGNVFINGEIIGKKTSLNTGDEVSIIFPEAVITEVRPIKIPLDILYEDDDIIIVNKKSGMVTHPGAGTGEDTLVHALLYHTKGKLAIEGGAARPGVVHRLDKETSGAIVFAKTGAAYYALIEMFAERRLEKQYTALIDGSPNLLAGIIREPIGRHPENRIKMAVVERGKPARTDWFITSQFGKMASEVTCVLHTGRTHQIRVHLSFLGHPILGDRLYGKILHKHQDWPMPRVMLHAKYLKFLHPITGKEIEISAPVPDDFLALKDFLKKSFGETIRNQK